MLEEENATLQQLNIEDNEQILIEGIICFIYIVLINWDKAKQVNLTFSFQFAIKIRHGLKRCQM